MMMKTYYKIGGCLNPNHPSYVTRKADQELLDYLKGGEYCFVLNSRQMGKSSLRVKTAKNLRGKGIKCAAVDISLLGNSISTEQWYHGFADLLLDSLELEDNFDFNEEWHQYQGLPEHQKLNKLIELILVRYIQSNLVIFIDEIDGLINRNFKDDFFAFIRGCYNQRAEKKEFNRLCFCLLGVISPNDLIKDKSRTPFNIGHSIELTGLTFEESKQGLIEGLASEFKDSETLLKEVLEWTGGQPFLTQKLCNLVLQNADKNAPNVSAIVQDYIINNWESQDDPEHLRTLRDRLLRDQIKSVNLLGLYEQILREKSIIFENTDEQNELRLTGLVTQDQNYLKVYNPIYEAVFNADWIAYQLDNQRPYSYRLKAWLESGKDNPLLLQGKSLEEALEWSKDKNLSSLDYQFLAASQGEQDQQKERILAQAYQQAAKLLKGTVILAIAILMTTVFYSYNKINKVQKIIELEQKDKTIEKTFETEQIEGLIDALKGGKVLKSLVNSQSSISDYPTLTPISRLAHILNKITLKNQIKLRESEDIQSIDFSPDGNIIASGHGDGTIHLWTTEGTLIKSLKVQGKFNTASAIDHLKFSPNHKIIVAINRDGIVSMFRNDGTFINKVEILDTQEIKENNRVYTLEFSPDSQLIGVGMNGKIKLLTREGKLVKILRVENQNQSLRMYSLAFSVESQLIASGGEDGKIRIWRQGGQLERVIKAHNHAINALIFDANTQKIVSSGDDGIIKLWTLGGQLVKSFQGDSSPIFALKVSNNGKFLAAVNAQGWVNLWRVNNEKVYKILKTPRTRLLNLYFQQEGDKLITASQEGMIRFWHISPPSSGDIPLSSLAYASRDNLRVIGKLDGTIELRTKNDQLLKKIKKQSEIIGVFFHPNEQSFFTVTSEGVIEHWDKTGNLIKVVMESQGNLKDVAFNPIDLTFIMVDEEGTVKAFSLEGKFIKNLLNKEYSVSRIAVHPQGKLFAFASESQGLNLWQENGNKISYIPGDKTPIIDLSFSPDGKMLGVSYSGGIVQVLRIDKTPLLTLTDAEKEITSILFTPDSAGLLMGTDEGNISEVFLTVERLISQGCEWLAEYNNSYADSLKNADNSASVFPCD